MHNFSSTSDSLSAARISMYVIPEEHFIIISYHHVPCTSYISRLQILRSQTLPGALASSAALRQETLAETCIQL